MHNQIVVLWLTRRMLLRLLPPMLQWLQKQAPESLQSDIAHGFMQQAARVELQLQSPLAASDRHARLVDSVNITRTLKGIHLCFNCQGTEPVADLMLSAKRLRQWLNILYDASMLADWPMGVWPDWIVKSTKIEPIDKSVLLH